MTSVLVFTLLLCGFGLEVNAEYPVPPDIRCSNFPPGFTWYNGRCFRFVKQQKDWYEAEKACNRFGGHLASIRTQDEHEFINDLTLKETGSNTRAWVGGHKGRVWTWSDGSPFTFSSWSPGEPNNAGGNENCMRIHLRSRDYVDDANCDITLSFVCSKEAS
ncbi:galactose-specific lectin nattectin [Fundulus heteroclitus]|uniref:galactose-specific lectin nattectin n=1 Tax=Fundulus heteroclitus TaxID=8078 RepID=UPI00165BAEC0|nr:galactose-specific lectin nattectin [Fundulus heteroclitus]